MRGDCNEDEGEDEVGVEKTKKKKNYLLKKSTAGLVINQARVRIALVGEKKGKKETRKEKKGEVGV